MRGFLGTLLRVGGCLGGGTPREDPRTKGREGMRLTSLLAAGAALAAVAAGTTASSSAQVSVQLPNIPNGLSTLTGNVLQSLDKATPVSSAPAQQRMRIGIVVAHPHQAAESAAMRSIYNPS